MRIVHKNANFFSKSKCNKTYTFCYKSDIRNGGFYSGKQWIKNYKKIVYSLDKNKTDML